MNSSNTDAANLGSNSPQATSSRSRTSLAGSWAAGLFATPAANSPSPIFYNQGAPPPQPISHNQGAAAPAPPPPPPLPPPLLTPQPPASPQPEPRPRGSDTRTMAQAQAQDCEPPPPKRLRNGQPRPPTSPPPPPARPRRRAIRSMRRGLHTPTSDPASSPPRGRRGRPAVAPVPGPDADSPPPRPLRFAPPGPSLSADRIYQTPSFPLDVRIKIWDRVYLLSSVGLRAGSEWFSVSLGGTGVTSKRLLVPDGNIKWEFISVVGKDHNDLPDGDWYLNSVSQPHSTPVPMVGYAGDPAYEMDVFESFLSGLFDQEYGIPNIAVFTTLVDHAQYYIATPKISRSLDTLFLHDHTWGIDLLTECVEVLPLAQKLQHKILFSDCMILVLGPRENPRFLNLPASNPREVALTELARELENRMFRYLDALHGNMMMSFGRYGPLFVGLEEIAAHCTGPAHHITGNSSFYTPQYYREIHQQLLDSINHGGGNHTQVEGLIRPMLENSLRLLNMGNSFVAGSTHKDHFFCNVIRDEDLPW
ncbi:hypothetical protein B7494_g29 [Chlorociboria aeruginascens]|nr:hypothetical protein B7494_g29 [Chlorociboria aeruginascens]